MISNFKTTLTTALAAGGSETTLDLDAVTTNDSQTIVITDFPSGKIRLTINPEGSTREDVYGTGISTLTITGLVRGLSEKGDDTSITANKKVHYPGETVIISNPGNFLKNDLVTIGDDQDVAGEKTFTDNLIRVGDDTNSDMYFYAENADSDKPFIFYDASTNAWSFSNDGVSSTAIGGGASVYTGGDGIDITSSVVKVDTATNPGLEISSNKLRVKVHTAAATKLTRDTNGIGLDQAATPTWTGAHIFSSTLDIDTATNFKLGGVAYTGTMADLNEAETFFGLTDMTGTEAETLTDDSVADTLHAHELDFIHHRIGTCVRHIGSANDGWTETVLNGSVNRGSAGTVLVTVATDNNSARLTSPELGYSNSYDWDTDMEFAAVVLLSSITNQDVEIGFTDSATGQIKGDSTSTDKHIGFIILDNAIYASMADGATQTKSAAITGITLTDYNVFRIVVDAGTNAKFYINDVLKVTATANQPSGADAIYATFGIRTDANEDKQLTLGNDYIVTVKP